MKTKDIKIEVSFESCSPEELKDRQERFLSVLMKGAIKATQGLTITKS